MNEIVRINKFNDYAVEIDDKLNIAFNHKGSRVEYPLDESKILVKPYSKEVTELIQGATSNIAGKKAHRFIKDLNLDITPFIWLLMTDNEIDLLFDEKSIFIRNNFEFIILNNKNCNMDIINKLYGGCKNNQPENYFLECKTELYEFIKERIFNNIGADKFTNDKMKGYRSTVEKIDKEYFRSNYNFSRMLFLYEKLIRIKQNYLNEDHFLISSETLDEYYKTLEEIKQILKR